MGFLEPQWFQPRMQYAGGRTDMTDMTDSATVFASASSLPPSSDPYIYYGQYY